MHIYEISDFAIDKIAQGRSAALKAELELDAYQGLSLAGVSITQENVGLYCQALSALAPHSLRFLDISRCALSDALLAQLLPVIHALGISKLKVSTNPLTMEGYQQLLNPISSVKHLVLSHCALNDIHASQLVPAIVACTSLDTLDLRHNHLSDKSFDLLAEQLPALKLADLRLKGNLPTIDCLYRFTEKLVQSGLQTGLISIDLLEMRNDARMRELCQYFVNAKIEPMRSLVHAFKHFSLNATVATNSSSDISATHRRRFSQ
ncbi:MAG: hypothetical protein AB7D28_06830 [Candidatus Berkiella sp.]